MGKTIYQKASISYKTQKNTNRAVGSHKQWKVPGSNNIQAEVIMYGMKEIRHFMFKVYQKTRQEE